MRKRKTHSPEFRAKGPPETIREETTLSELSGKCGVHPNQISTWKRATAENLPTALSRRGTATLGPWHPDSPAKSMPERPNPPKPQADMKPEPPHHTTPPTPVAM